MNADGAYQRYLRESRIIVDRAPVGMSRQKLNQSRHIQRSKRIVWTVEWVDIYGVKTLSEVDQNLTLSEAYAQMRVAKDRESRKRKRDLEDDLVKPADANKATPDQQQQTTDHSHPVHQLEQQDGSSSADQQQSLDPATDTNTQPTASTDSPVNTSGPVPPALTPHLYLRRPHTTSSLPVLIPLPDEDTITLTTALHNRVVLEFPTIYALTESPDNLPSTYTTEEKYLAGRRAADDELRGIVEKLPDDVRRRDGKGYGGDEGEEDEEEGGERLDQERILEMLRRDVRA